MLTISDMSRMPTIISFFLQITEDIFLNVQDAQILIPKHIQLNIQILILRIILLYARCANTAMFLHIISITLT